VNYILIPWDFPRVSELLGIELGWLNKSVKDSALPDITPEMQYHLDLVYETDYQLWELINS
jgi:hypothetical protein